MISKFLLLFGQLNLFFLSELSQQNIAKKYGLIKTKAIKIFEFDKNNQRY